MSLAEYQRKRHFNKTAEPQGNERQTKARKQDTLSFVVQKHAASHLHYDFRLELDGTLKSWAVPKGPSLDPAQKRLAVHVEDHPLEYATFEGAIPAGEYGGGEVIVWDRGTWLPDTDPHEGLRKGKIEFELRGEKLNGAWRLIQLKGREGGKNWLLMKRHDAAATEPGEPDMVELAPASVISGRTLQDIAAGKPATMKPRASFKKKQPAQKAVKKAVRKTEAEPAQVTAKSRARNKKKSGGSKKAATTKLEPASFQLATLASEVPQGKEWVHEIKYDGYRLLCTLENGVARLWTRNHLDWTHRFSSIAAAAVELKLDSAMLDGEIVALNEKGVSSFQALQNSLKGIESQPLVYYVFDLLHLNGEDLRTLPLAERKRQLKKLLPKGETGRIRFSDDLSGDGETFLDHCCRLGLEGIISKRNDRPYTAGRGDDWLKIKCLQQEELVIGGFTISAAEKRGFGALLLGFYQDGHFTYAGRVGTGFDARLLTSLRKELNELEVDRCPFDKIPARERGSEVRWVRPKLVSQIQFTGWTDERVLRHAAFLGLREDKTARSVGVPESLSLQLEGLAMPVKKESTKQVKTIPSKARRAKSVAKDDNNRSEVTVAYPLTNPGRVFYPEIAATKLELASYYQRIADWMLPYLEDRPLSLLRCPEGQAKTCFFQKHAAAGTPGVLRRIEIGEKKESETYLIADDLPGLLSLAQMGVLEIHVWGSRGDRLEQPDWLVFDLDPAPDVDWKEVVATAQLMRELLEQMKLKTFIKVTGGKGLHIVAPLNPRRAKWPEVKEFTLRIAQFLAEQYPRRYIAKMSKAARQGKIFIDYLRNDRGSTAIAPFSTRAKAAATVSVPITWEELPRIKPDQWTIRNLPQRLEQLQRDPWEGFFQVKQSLPKLDARISAK